MLNYVLFSITFLRLLFYVLIISLDLLSQFILYAFDIFLMYKTKVDFVYFLLIILVCIKVVNCAENLTLPFSPEKMYPKFPWFIRHERGIKVNNNYH